MITRLLVFLFVFACWTSALGQGSKLDSLREALTISKGPQEKFRALKDLGEYFESSEYDSAIHYCKSALALAQSELSEEEVYDVMAVLSRVYYYEDILDSAINLNKAMYKIAEEIHNSEKKASALAEISFLLSTQDKYQEALLYADSALSLSKNITDTMTSEHAYSWYIKGHQELVLGKIDQSKLSFEQGLKIARVIDDKYQILLTLQDLADVQILMGDYTNALSNLFYSRQLDAQLDSSSMGEIDLSMANVHFLLKNDSLTLSYLSSAKKIAHHKRDVFLLARTHDQYASYYSENKNYNSALQSYREATQMLKSAGYICEVPYGLYGIAESMFELEYPSDSISKYVNQVLEIGDACGFSAPITSAYLLLGEVYLKEMDFERTKELLDQGFDLVITRGFKDIQSDYYATYSELYYRWGKWKLSRDYLALHKSLSDSLLNVEEVRKATQVEEKYKFDQEKSALVAEQEKEKLILEARKENAILYQQIAVTGGLLSVIITLLIAWASKERKKVNQKLLFLNNELNDKNQKLEQLDQYRTRFLANINHDFRTPLTLIIGRLTQMDQDNSNYLTVTSEHHLQQVKENVNTLKEMSEEIQSLIKLEEGDLVIQWTSLKVVEFTEFITMMFLSRAEMEGKQLSFRNISEIDHQIHLDKKLYIRMINNLISNALKFTEKEDIIEVLVEVQAEKAVIRVKDSGIGIQSADLPHIFHRFYQSSDSVHATQEGFGIGLTLVRELAELHGGFIVANSKEGKGSVFTLELPYNLDKEAIADVSPIVADIKKPNPAAINIKGEQSILVVEDHATVREYILEVISNKYTVYQAANGEEALVQLDKHEIDLIVTDLMMPWMDGFELIERVQQNEAFKHIPIMVVSARTSEEDRLSILGLGVNDFLSKPFNVEEFQKRVENILDTNDAPNTWHTLSKNKRLKDNVEKDILSKVHDLVISKIDDPKLGVNSIAEVLCASISKTNTLINELTGQPPKAYIKGIRFEYVHHLIKTRKVSTARDAALSIGMKNGTEFKNQYVKQFGELPFK